MIPDFGEDSTEDKWLGWIQRLQAIAQDGLTYSEDTYDLGRYEMLRDVAAEILAAHSQGNIEEARELLELETGPATPKVDVRAAVFRGDEILLVKELADSGWSLPGGWADVGESPAEATVREVYEESGYEVRAVKLLAAYDRDRHGHPPIPYHVYKLVFLCELLDNFPSGETDTEEATFFVETEVPELSTSRVTRDQIARLFEHHRHPELSADFD